MTVAARELIGLANMAATGGGQVSDCSKLMKMRSAKLGCTGPEGIEAA
jgi:hypothetical protein